MLPEEQSHLFTLCREHDLFIVSMVETTERGRYELRAVIEGVGLPENALGFSPTVIGRVDRLESIVSGAE